MEKKDSVVLMDSQRVDRSLKRIAYQIAEANDASRPVTLLGINEGGGVIAQKLAQYLSKIYGPAVSIETAQFLEDGRVVSGFEADSMEKSFIILVDDVIFSGQTMFKALRYLADLIDLKEVHIAILVDRGHRKFPVSARFSGLELPTKLKEHVSVVISKKKIEKVVLSKTSK